MDISAFNHLPLQFVLLLLLLNNYETVAYHDDTHNVAKRLNVDVCAGLYLQHLSSRSRVQWPEIVQSIMFIDFTERFDIHSSTIIRTEESKAMGAKFLNDDDVVSADACMKLCCETNECDVFIYEEKVNKYLRLTAGWTKGWRIDRTLWMNHLEHVSSTRRSV